MVGNGHNKNLSSLPWPFVGVVFLQLSYRPYVAVVDFVCGDDGLFFGEVFGWKVKTLTIV